MRILLLLSVMLTVSCGKQERIVIRDSDVKSTDVPKSGKGTAKTSENGKQSDPQPKKKTPSQTPKAKQTPDTQKSATTGQASQDKPTKPLTFDPDEPAPTIVRPTALTHVKPARPINKKKPRLVSSKKQSRRPAGKKPIPTSTVTHLVGTWICRPTVPTDAQLEAFLTRTGVPQDQLAKAREQAKKTIQRSKTKLVVRSDGTLRQIDTVQGATPVEQDGRWQPNGQPQNARHNLTVNFLAGTDLDTGKLVFKQLAVRVDVLSRDRIRWQLPAGATPLPDGMVFDRASSDEHLQFIRADDQQAVAALRQLQVPLDLGVKGEVTGLTLSAEAIAAAGKHLAGLRSVRRLHVGYGDVAPILPTIGKLATLRELFLDQSGLQDTHLQQLAGLTQLHRLSLKNNPVGDAGMAAVVKIQSLRTLVLNGTRVTDQGLAQLVKLPHLDSLDISATKIQGGGLLGLSKSKKFTHLAAASTSIDDQGLTAIGQLTRLQSLSLMKCTQVTDKGLVALRGLQNLQELWLTDSKITGVGFGSLTKLPLTALQAAGSRVNDNGLAQIAKCDQLRTVILDRSAITDAGLKHLRNHGSLRVLSLADCAIQGPGLSDLAALTKLDFLELANTKISDKAVAALAGSHLRVLGLGGTTVSNELVPTLLKMKQLRELHLMGSRIDDTGREQLKSARPKLIIR